MADSAHPETTTYQEQAAVTHPAEHGEVNPLAVSGPMVLWTWVTFGLLALVLYKFAWKPILAGLDNREETIRKSLDDADRVRQKLDDLEQNQSAMIAEADETAKDIMAQARKAAAEASRVMEERARADAQIVQDNARREIQAAEDKAAAQLRRESAELAVALTGRILGEELTPDRQKTLTNRLIQEI